MDIGPHIKTLLSERDMSQSQLAQSAALNRSELNRSLNGHRSFKVAELARISRALGLPLEGLTEGKNLGETARDELDAFLDVHSRLVRALLERDMARDQLAAHQAEAEARYTELRLALDRLVAEGEERLRDEVEGRERALRSLHDELRGVRRALASSQAAQATLRRQNEELQEKLSRSRRNQLGSALLGTFLGAALSTGDSDDYED